LESHIEARLEKIKAKMEKTQTDAKFECLEKHELKKVRTLEELKEKIFGDDLKCHVCGTDAVKGEIDYSYCD
jgi:transcription elongation factor Elf1